jgi:type VI protein secretion system component Hcp
MSVRRSAGAIFWGLTLVAIGSLLLAYNLGYPIHIWPYVVRYWPGLLIVWGLLKFVDFFRLRHAGDRRPLFSASEVALLILVIFAGSAITTAANVSPEIGRIFDIGDIDLWDITGDNYNYDQHLERQGVVSGSEIEIVNFFGDIDVRPAGSDQIIVDVKKTIRAANRGEADRLDRDFTFSIQEEGSRYRIMSNRDQSGFHGTPRQRFKSSLTVRVPKNAALHLDNRNGRVSVQDLFGNQNLTNRYGEVDVRNITGQLQIENRNGSVTVQDISDSVEITNRYANTTVKNVGGDLRIETRNGLVYVSGVSGNATIDNSYAPINAENIKGSLNVTGRNNSIDVQHVEGDIQADSSYENVNIKDARGAITVSSRNGDLMLSLVRPPEKDIAINGRYSNVTLELPSGSSFGLDARTEYGQVYSEFEEIRTIESNRERSLTGRVGRGGPRISVSLRNGDIRLVKRG